MTNSPHERTIYYKTAEQLENLFNEQGFEKILAECKSRSIADDSFYPSKATHPTTVREQGTVFTDDTGIRAVIFHYTHSGETVVRSIKRLTIGDSDYRLPQPHA